MTTAITAMLRQFQAIPPSAQVKAVKETCVTYGGSHPYYQCLAVDGNTFPELRNNIQEYGSAAAANYNQGNLSYRPQGVANQMRPPVANPKSDLKAIITRSGVSYDGPSKSSPVVENAPKATKDTVIPTNNGNTKDVQPQVVFSESPVSTSEPANTPVSASKPNPQASIPYPSRRNDERNQEKAKDQIEKFYQILKDMSFEINFTDALILMPKFASTLKALIGNKEKLSEMARTPLNEHCSAVLLKKLLKKLGDPDKFLIPCDFSGMAECSALADLGACINLMQYSMWKKLSLPDLTPTCMTLELADRSLSRPVRVAEDVYVKVGSFHFPADFVVVDFDDDPRVPLILGRSFLKTEKALIDVFEGELTLRVGKVAITFNLDQTSRYSANYNDMTAKRIDVIDMACEEYSQEVLGFFDTASSGNPTPLFDPIISATSPTLTPFGEKGDNKLPVIIAKDLSVEEKAALITVLKSHKRAIAWKLSDIKGINPEFCSHKILLEEYFTPAVQHQRRVNSKIHDVISKRCMMAIFHDMIEKTMEVFMDDFSVFGDSFQSCLSHLEKMLKRCEDTNLCLNWEKSHFMVKEGIVLGHKISKKGIKVDKAKIDVISKLPHPTTVKGDNKLPVIIAKDLSVEEKAALITVLKSHKRAIAWKLSDIKGINPKFRSHKILLEEDFTPAVQHQRRVNPKIYDVIKQEVIKLLDAGLIYPISDSSWVSPVHCVPKKGGFTIVENEENELIPTRLVTGWRVYIDYRILNDATQKDHFPLPFMDQMLERLAGNQYYYFLDGFSGYFQIPIDPKDQEKTTFTCPYWTFAYRRMPFGLCNAPGMFQRCMMAIFYDMIEKTMEVFMDDFSVFGDSFQSCLSHLEKMLKSCEDTNLCLNWEKRHFMVKECIVLGHKISKKRIEVDKAKIDVISKLPHPTTVKGIRSFLGHAGFYRRFIKDFSKVAMPITRLLEKDTPFVFSQECVDAFQTLKRMLTETPILIASDWNMPFELMCDASDYAIRVVLGQRRDKHFRPIHYASKTMTEAELKYTTTEKEMLAVVYAFENFWSYLIMNKSIVYTDHSALKYLFSKKDSKARLLRWVLLL
nr:reverse transcriptase domain-containing protein [Tanacetum cinerariifolium]